MTRTDQEKLSNMQEGGAKLGAIMTELLQSAQPGIPLLTLEELATLRIKEAGGRPSFQTVKGYKWATCLCVNEVVVHGVPSDYPLKKGDVLTIDIGMLYQGYHTDTAWTKLIKAQSFPRKDSGQAELRAQSYKDKEHFLEVGQQALWKAINQARVGNRVGHISKAIEETIKPAGYGIVKTLVGHGVGKKLHEPPQIPGLLKAPIESTLPLVAGMTLAIEIIYTIGNAAVQYPNNDGWSIATRDKSLAAVFEHTIAVADSGQPIVLTAKSK